MHSKPNKKVPAITGTFAPDLTPGGFVSPAHQQQK